MTSKTLWIDGLNFIILWHAPSNRHSHLVMSLASRIFKVTNLLLAPARLELRCLKGSSEPELPYDFNDETKATIRLVQPFTMTTPERIAMLVDATAHVVRHRIPGDLVECGVWKGGSSMAMAATLQRLGVTDRHLWLYDTFEGMSEPTAADATYDGQDASGQLASQDKANSTSVWCYSPMDEVRRNVLSTGFAEAALHFVKGRVEDTVPASAPETISLLRLDTDWYESTRHELENLYPRLTPGGVLIIDDYGYWKGARQAVDEYFSKHDPDIFFSRIDSSARMAIKPWRAA